MGFAVLAVAVLMVAPSCGDGSTRSVTSTTSPRTEPVPGSVSSPIVSLPPVSGPFAEGRTPLAGFDEVAVHITAPDGEARLFCVLAARSIEQRERGLMAVTDPNLGGYDGMLFEFPDDVTRGFWMRNTPMPLSIAYIDAAGAPVATFDMAPCRDSPTCPDYPPADPYRRALEVPQGRLDDLGLVDGARLDVAGRCAPATG